MRDNFHQKTITIIARRVAYLCSNPKCKRHTIGPQAEGEGSINIGVAAHITAASAGGPRYDASLNTDERRDASNGIWLCQACSKLIDSDDKHFTVKLLREWKSTAEERAFAEIASAPESLDHAAKITVELDQADRELIRRLGLPTHDDIEAVTLRLRTAAKMDIQTFKSTREWPRHSISLNLRTRDSSGIHAMSVTGVAQAINISSEITLVAAPGTGKTTTLVQLADAILSFDGAIAVLVPLAEWSSRIDSIFSSLTRRNVFQGFREQHFMLLAYYGRLALLLDGWNELDPVSRSRAIHELNALRRDYPLLSIVVSTRRQARDVPISGPMVEIDTLSEQQQLEIARAIRGRDGEALLDQAWRTPGVRELISIPLYLNALLTSATSGKMPTTKEEVLQLFVTEHENSPDKAEVLERELLGVHRELLAALAIAATQATNTTIQDSHARAIISQAEDRLVAAGQITIRPQPATVLDVLVNQHTLIRSGADSGVSFQHQQFQEWHASFEVERLMLSTAAGDMEVGRKLATDVLNMPAWEEPILFACDRLSRTDQAGTTAVAATILRTLSIDPMLAAVMIHRSSSAAWDNVKDKVISFAQRWHKPGTVDRAVNFMITTGRPEFAPQIWPLITNPDMQVHLSALRAARRFRPSVLGSDVQARIAVIPEEVRKHVIAEIAYNSGIDGIELATSLAKADPSASVQFTVIESLQFRRADRFVTDILKVATVDVWPLLARKGYADDIADPEAVARLQREYQSYVEGETDTLTKISMLLKGKGKDSAVAHKIATLIESENFPVKDNQAGWVVEKAFENFPQEIGAVLLNRIQAGRELPFRSRELLKDAAAIDEGVIPSIVIDSTCENRLANTAAVVVGPKTVGTLIDRFLALEEKIHGMEKPIDEATREEYFRLKGRISISRIGAFLPALQSHCDTKDPHRIGILADLLAGHGKDVEAGPLLAESALLEPIVGTVQHWVEVLLASPKADRHQFAEVVRAIERLPKPEFVDGLRRLLAEDLLRRQRARQEFFARPTRGPLPPDVTHSYTLQYRRAFAAIGDAQVVRLMEKYLSDLEFGFDAACILKDIWDKQQNVPKNNRFRSWPDFSEVKARREQRRDRRRTETSSYAEAIFGVIETLIHRDNTEANYRHALQLAKIALSMPHGDKSSVIKALLVLPRPMREKRDFLTSLVLAGETISADMILEGVRELLEDAKDKPWLLDENHSIFDQWLELLPFSDCPAAVNDALALVDVRLREPWRLRRLLSALGNAPSTQAGELLGQLVDRDSRFYREHEWLEAVANCGSTSSITMLLDRISDGKMVGIKGGIDGWTLARYLAGMIRNHPEMRTELIHRYEGQAAGVSKSVIEQAIAELADPDGLLALVRGYARDKRSFDGLLHRLVEGVALGKQPLADWGGNAYELYSVDMSPVRKRLFAMLASDPAEASVAEACLTAIDELRDEHGHVDSEPRHPDIATSRPWPLAAGST